LVTDLNASFARDCISSPQSPIPNPQSPVPAMQSEFNLQAALNFYNTGNELKNQGRSDEAIASYQKALFFHPDYAEVYNQLGEIYFTQRKLTEALKSCNRAIELKSDYAPAYKTLGNVLQAQGQIEQAVNAYDKALEINPEFAEAYVNKGSMLSKLGEHESAIVCLSKAIELKPEMAAAYWNLATVYIKINKLAESIDCRQKAFALEPRLITAESLNDLGTAIGQEGKFEEAINYYKKAIELQPNYYLAYLNWGISLNQIGQFNEAIEHLQKALQLKPDSGEAYGNIGKALIELNKISEGIAYYEKAVKLQPNSATAHFNLGTALTQQDKFEEAIAELQKAVELQPDLGEAYSNIGTTVYKKSRKYGELNGQEFNLAINSLIKALEINSELALPHLYLAQLISCPVQVSDFGGLRKASEKYLATCKEDNRLIAASAFISTHVKSGLHKLAREKLLEIEPEVYKYVEKSSPVEMTLLYCHLLFNLHYLRDDLEANSKLYHEVGQKYAEKIIAPKQIELPPSRKDNRPTDKLKIGVMSSHFARHSVGWCSADVITELSKLTPNLYLYFMGDRQADDRTKIFETAAAKFYRPKKTKNGDFDIKEIVEEIAKDELDILIELDSLTAPLQVEIIYYQPATVCLSWLGFEAPFTNPNNYFLCDWQTHPEGREKYNREQLVRMPDSFIAVGGFKSDRVDRKLIRRGLRIAEDQIVYLCVAPGYKLNPEMIQAQVKILKEVPDSVIFYKGHTGDSSVIEAAYKDECQVQGVGFQRIKFLSKSKTEEEHRQIYQVADILLDSYPYNGGTHTLEALWFNLPVVTRSGEPYLSRMGYSFLQSLSISTGVANSWSEYTEWGIKLGKDEELRKATKEKLVQSKQPETLAPLWNPQKFAQDMYNVFAKLVAEKSGIDEKSRTATSTL